MSKIYIHDNATNQRVVFFCPACRIEHYVQVALKQGGSGPIWDWNGSDEEPSFVQPICLSIDNLTGASPYLCKSTITDGQIKFAAESTHDMAGQTSPLPDFLIAMPILFSIVRALTGEPAPGTYLCFRRTSGIPSHFGGDVLSSSDLLVMASNVGFWRTPIEPGEYFVWIGGSSRRLIVVPETPDYIMLGDLFSGQLGSVSTNGENWRLSNAERQLVNADTGEFQTVFVDDVSGIKEIAFAAPAIGSAVANFRYRSGMLELFCAETNTWHAPYLDNGVFALAANNSLPQIVDRILGGRWQLKDITTGFYRTWFVTGSVGSESLAFGPEEA